MELVAGDNNNDIKDYIDNLVPTPKDYICPITRSIFQDPVFARRGGGEGQFYERVEINTWLQQKQTDPLSNEALSTNDVEWDGNSHLRRFKQQIETFQSTKMSKQVEKIRSNISDALIRKDVNKVKQNIKALNYIVQTEKNIVLSDDDVEIYKSAWNQLSANNTLDNAFDRLLDSVKELDEEMKKVSSVCAKLVYAAKETVKGVKARMEESKNNAANNEAIYYTLRQNRITIQHQLKEAMQKEKEHEQQILADKKKRDEEMKELNEALHLENEGDKQFEESQKKGIKRKYDEFMDTIKTPVYENNYMHHLLKDAYANCYYRESNNSNAPTYNIRGLDRVKFENVFKAQYELAIIIGHWGGADFLNAINGEKTRNVKANSSHTNKYKLFLKKSKMKVKDDPLLLTWEGDLCATGWHHIFGKDENASVVFYKLAAGAAVTSNEKQHLPTIFQKENSCNEEEKQEGYALAQTNLGYMYENGLGVDPDVKKAVKWYTKAAEQGHAQGQCSLAYMYEKGNGVEKNLAKAKELYSKAADQGHKPAIDFLPDINRQLAEQNQV
eukprot:g5063.t1